MSTTTKTPEARSAVGVKAMTWAVNPALMINPDATAQDLLSWAAAEVENLYAWLDILACSRSDLQIEPHELATVVTERLAPVLQGMRAALESRKV